MFSEASPYDAVPEDGPNCRSVHKFDDKCGFPESKEKDTMTPTAATQRGTEQATDKAAIRPFHVDVPETELTELSRRVNAT